MPNDDGILPGLKAWARDIFLSKQTDHLLRDRAHKVLDGVFAATGLPEPPSLNREWCADSIYNIISDRYKFKCSTPRGQLTKHAVHAKRVKAHTRKLIADLKSSSFHPFRSFYDADERTLDWSALLRGLARLETIAETQASYYQMARKFEWKGENIISSEIAPLYRGIFKKKPSRSRHHDTHKPGGPFVRFVQYLERETNPFEARVVALETIVKAAWPSRSVPNAKRASTMDMGRNFRNI
jgi:hypothetical protein